MPHPNSNRAVGTRRSDARCRGTIYLYFLSVGVLAMVVALGALLEIRVQARQTQAASAIVVTRFYAHSAVEQGLVMIRNNPQWRKDLGSGRWINDRPIGDGTMRLDAIIIDDDGDGNPDNNDVVLTGTGAIGGAVHQMQVVVDDGINVLAGSWQQIVN